MLFMFTNVWACICTEILSPVCGDGKYYGNECSAKCAGAKKIVAGKCGEIDQVNLVKETEKDHFFMLAIKGIKKNSPKYKCNKVNHWDVQGTVAKAVMTCQYKDIHFNVFFTGEYQRALKPVVRVDSIEIKGGD